MDGARVVADDAVDRVDTTGMVTWLAMMSLSGTRPPDQHTASTPHRKYETIKRS